jgi:hypothetical protein
MNGFFDLLTAGRQSVGVAYFNGRYLHDVCPQCAAPEAKFRALITSALTVAEATWPHACPDLRILL